MEPEARMETALQQARQGDTGAFAEIVREHQAMVFSIGWHYLADRALAEEKWFRTDSISTGTLLIKHLESQMGWKWRARRIGFPEIIRRA